MMLQRTELLADRHACMDNEGLHGLERDYLIILTQTDANPCLGQSSTSFNKMSGKHTAVEQQPSGNSCIMLLEDACRDAQEIAPRELDAHGELAEVIEWQLSKGWCGLWSWHVNRDAVPTQALDTDEQGTVSRFPC